jgi:hypothetical protein
MEERLALIVDCVAELTRKLTAFIAGVRASAAVDGLFRGQARPGQSFLAGVDTDEERQRAVETWMHTREYSRLLEAWVNGLSIDWPALYLDGALPHRISLPTYPFARESYWHERDSRPVQPRDLSVDSPSVQEKASGEREGAWNGLSYLPTWEEQGLSASAPAIPEHRTVLLVYPSTSAPVASTIAEMYSQRQRGCTVIHLQLADSTEQVATHVWRCDIHDAHGIESCLQAYERIDAFYVIAVQADDPGHTLDSIRHSLQTYEMQTLRLVKYLKHREMLGEPVDCYLLTLDNYRLDGSAANPTGGGLTGRPIVER